MDERILNYIKDKDVWKSLGDLVGKQMNALTEYRKNMNVSWQKMRSEGKVTEEKIKSWVVKQKDLIAKKENTIDILRDVYNYLDAHLGDAFETRKRIKKLTELLEKKVLVKGKLPKELMEDQQKALQKVVNELLKITKESKEISEKTKHNI